MYYWGCRWMTRPAAVVAALLLLSHFPAPPSRAQDAAGRDAEGMPKTQREVVEQVVQLNKRHQEASKLENKLARKEAMAAVKAEREAWLANLNKRLTAEGPADWIGHARVTASTLTVENRDDNSLRVAVHISVQGLPGGAKEAVKLLAKGELVKYSIAANAKTPLRFAFTPSGGISAHVNGSMVTKLSKLGPE